MQKYHAFRETELTAAAVDGATPGEFRAAICRRALIRRPLTEDMTTHIPAPQMSAVNWQSLAAARSGLFSDGVAHVHASFRHGMRSRRRVDPWSSVSREESGAHLQMVRQDPKRSTRARY
jgi:hypothetical protein